APLLLINQYAVAPSAGHVQAALASGVWVAYVATSANGDSMLYVTSRSSRHTLALLPAPQSTRITLSGMSDQWVIWQSGANLAAGPWTLLASRLPASATGADAAQSAPVVLASNADSAAQTPAVLNGLWIEHDTALVALSTHGPGGEILRLDLFADQGTPVSRVIARTALRGHALTDPSVSGTTYYWAEVWLDSANALHGDVWRGNGISQPLKVTQTGLAFAPRTTAQTLIWTQTSAAVPLDTTALTTEPAQVIQSALDLLGGTIQSRNLTGGGDRELAAHGGASSLQVSGTVLVWRDSGEFHTFDLSRNGPSTIEGQIRDATYAGATGTSLVWGQSSSATINVFDHD
ncbi:MAG TPA: hypothetical protein VGN32_12370, partial [Ktedonobacterales bacterium]|nr:hypothetical protein [Ktedonobacterales bacterium]